MSGCEEFGWADGGMSSFFVFDEEGVNYDE